ncbi:MAG: DUF1624 domain-containing protein [Gammaproteobacteria bacterium]|nr:DUF1624 domain-containing protein [Gammaproteobacteria bacterium]
MSDSHPQRIILIDLLRGIAIAMMFVYHFCFDLTYFGYTHSQFNSDPFWLNFRAVIVSLFLGVVGFSLYLAHHRKWNKPAWLKRAGILIAASVAVSASSYLMYPDSFIFFGILHFIALASILGVVFVRFGHLNLLLGTVILLMGNHYGNDFFNQPAMQWVGMMTIRPITEDYVPLFPWFGMILIGIWLANWSINSQVFRPILYWQNQHPITSTLCFAGRHSLLIYLLHQPIFLGLLYVVTILIRS